MTRTRCSATPPGQHFRRPLVVQTSRSVTVKDKTQNSPWYMLCPSCCATGQVAGDCDAMSASF